MRVSPVRVREAGEIGISMFVEISTNIACDVNCSYCPQRVIVAAYGNAPRMMTLDTFAAVLDHIPPATPLIFAGFSEPYQNRMTGTFIEYAAGHGFPWQMNTTGYMMDHRDIDTILGNPPFNLTLHVPRGGPRLSNERIQRLCALPKFGITGPEFHSVLEPFAKWFAVLPLQTRAGNIEISGVPRCAPKKGRLRCMPAPNLNHPIILPDGRVILCCQDMAQRHILGNVTTQTWAEIAASEPLAKVWMALEGHGDCLCRTCEFAECVG